MDRSPPTERRRRRGRRVIALIYLAALALSGALTFGISARDHAAMLAFSDAVQRWQVDPEFRSLAADYSIRGSEAMRCTPLGMAAAREIMAIRSCPGLPPEYAVNATSHAHYENFSRGPLSAYLYLSGEQNVSGIGGLFEALGRKPACADADCQALLDGIHMDWPVVKDRGAVQCVRTLAEDIDAGRPLAIKQIVPELLRPHIAAIATQLGFPSDAAQMTPAQQRAVLDRLDAHVKLHDHELWRTKQVSDFCGGFWAQLYGPPYNQVLLPALAIHSVARVVFALLLAGFALRGMLARPATRAQRIDALPPVNGRFGRDAQVTI